MTENLTLFAATLDVDIPRVDENTLLANGLDLVYFLGGTVCIIVLIVAGIMYTVSNGDSGKVQTAKNAILYAVVGLVVLIMAFTITGFVIGRFN